MPGSYPSAEFGAQKTFPSSVVIVGAGIFGLSTALAVARRYPATNVVVVDRLVPPVADGSSVDTTRCIRFDYPDPIYARLARTSMDIFWQDSELRTHLHQQGMTFVCDGRPSRFTDGWETTYHHTKSMMKPGAMIEMRTREEVFQRIHGKGAIPPSVTELGKQPMWNRAYCNMEDAFIDAKACVQVYYERCLKSSSIQFRCGSPVKRINIVEGRSRGVTLEDGNTISAEMVIVAAGAWSNKLVDLGTRQYPIGHEVVWIKVTPEEAIQWKDMSITTNESTGLNVFPPYQGEVKVLRRSPGYKNTVTVPHPEDPSKTLAICSPRTLVTNPTDVIPADAEAAMRADLREIMPPLADRPFDRTRICWISTTPTADFLIAPHPRIGGIHLATGGSAHAWKFVPVIGDIVVDSMEGSLSEELVEKFAFHKYSGGKDHNAPRMDGKPEELRDVVRSRT